MKLMITQLDFITHIPHYFQVGEQRARLRPVFLTRRDMEVLQNNSANIGRLIWREYVKEINIFTRF